MIKMYLHEDLAGCSPEFWEENWQDGNFEQSLRFCAVDPLRPLFEKYTREGSLVLEGGCGLGQYLAYYDWRGRRVVGVDFAQEALKMLRSRQPKLDLSVGDVSRLPFANGTFDLYYSGGVVEHFEHGAAASLKEAERVLKPDGVLLISVPYYSPFRRILFPFKSGEWRRVERAEVDPIGSQREKRFFQYAYRPNEFERLLSDAGLRVLEKQGYAVVWGLKEFPFLNGGLSESSGSGESRGSETPTPVDIEPLAEDQSRSLAKRLVVSEDASVPLLGRAVRFMRWFAANMMMYVCVRNDSRRHG